MFCSTNEVCEKEHGRQSHTQCSCVWLKNFQKALAYVPGRAMAVLATSLLRDLASEQRARNSLFPEASDSPLVWSCGAAFGHQLHHLLELTGSPLQDLSSLQVFCNRFGQQLAETMGPVSHGDFGWLAHCPRPSESDRTAAVHDLEISLRVLQPSMSRWRTSLTPSVRQRWEDLVEGCCVSLQEIAYFGTFDMLDVLASFFRQAEIQIQLHESDDARSQGPSQWRSMGRSGQVGQVKGFPMRGIELDDLSRDTVKRHTHRTAHTPRKRSETNRKCWTCRCIGRHIEFWHVSCVLRRWPAASS